MSTLFEPFRVGSMLLPTRLVLPAMVTRLSGEDGLVNDDIRARYARFSRGGVGLRNAGGTLVESIAYGNAPAAHPFAEGGIAAPVALPGSSCARAPFDGADTDVNGSDFTLTEVGTSTPRAPSTP